MKIKLDKNKFFGKRVNTFLSNDSDYYCSTHIEIFPIVGKLSTYGMVSLGDGNNITTLHVDGNKLQKLDNLINTLLEFKDNLLEAKQFCDDYVLEQKND